MVICHVFFPQIIERRKTDSMEPDRSGFKFWVCQIFATWPCRLSPCDPQFPPVQTGDGPATSQVEVSTDRIRSTVPDAARLLHQQTNCYSTNAKLAWPITWPEPLGWPSQGTEVSLVWSKWNYQISNFLNSQGPIHFIAPDAASGQRQWRNEVSPPVGPRCSYLAQRGQAESDVAA